MHLTATGFSDATHAVLACSPRHLEARPQAKADIGAGSALFNHQRPYAAGEVWSYPLVLLWSRCWAIMVLCAPRRRCVV